MGDLTEDELLRALRRLIPRAGPGVRVGPGDDAAVVEMGDRLELLTVDMLVEGVDFDLGWVSARDLGYKAVAVNVSDIAAMGGSPRHALVALGLPRATEPGWVVELFGGIGEAAEEHALAVVGGDLSASAAVVISVTLTGEAPAGGAVTRAGARPGDRVVVTGVLGGAAGGLCLLRADPREAAEASAAGWGRDLLGAHFRPAARVGEGRILAGAGATAMIDVSDGLAKDLGRLCEESGVAAAIRPALVPRAPALARLTALAGVDPEALVLGGGEDFELLATLPAGAIEPARQRMAEAFGTPLTDIGEVREGEGLVAVDEDGAERPLPAMGWDHFAS